jgi:Tol biopolymer transport system component
MRTGSLWAVPFDLERLEPIGPEVPVVDRVHTGRGRGATAYAFSENGVLVYLPERPDGNLPDGSLSTLVWVSRDGAEEALDFKPARFGRLSLSPDGESLAVAISDSNGKSDIWVYDLERGGRSRLTSSPGDNNYPLWTPDSQRVVYDSRRDRGGLFSMLANGTGTEERLTESAIAQIPNSFSPDGDVLVFREGTLGADRSLHTRSLDGTLESLIQTRFFESNAAVSPDGRFIAYESTKSGDAEIYVRPFPDDGTDEWVVSREGGEAPRWSEDGRELFFLSLDGSVMLARVDSVEPFEIVAPELLLDLDIDSRYGRPYDSSPDGQRFLVRRFLDSRGVSEETTLVVVENWFEELSRLAPMSEQSE